jgi:phosphoribosylanthranilate isomerase
MISIKICGLKQPEEVLLCAGLGVSFVGFVAYPRSPRYVTPEQFTTLASLVTPPTRAVLVTVDAGDELLNEYLKLPSEQVRGGEAVGFGAVTAPFKNNLIQLHGSESPARLCEIRERYGCKIIKAISDPTSAADYADCADYLLIDAEPSPGELPGGNAKKADWGALRGFTPALPWFLSGGLNAQNVVEAIRVTGASMLDVSSGVERKRGVKDLALIEEFVHASRC